jgi:uncharacterized protein (TIGR02145 family)
MNEGSKITGHTTSSTNGTVYIGTSGHFIMNGGEISNNASTYTGFNYATGGVSFASGGKLTMNGGKITGNTANTAGLTPSDIYVVQNAGTVTLSGNAEIGVVRLGASASANASLTLDNWNGTTTAVHLVGNIDDISTAISYWDGKQVLKATSGSLTPADVAKFTLGNFYNTTIASQSIGLDYKIANTGADIGKLVARYLFFTDSRDGKSYKAVQIGDQIWMAENLNYAATGSKCGNGSSLSDGNTVTCDTYGRLYNWATAMDGAASSDANPSGVKGVCPAGWHIPSDAEWDTLIAYVHSDNGLATHISGVSAVAGKYLKAASGWNSSGNGLDTYGFAALSSGTGNSTAFSGTGAQSGFWSASEDVASNAYCRAMMYNDESVDWDADPKTNMYSVRCVGDL